jgi:hypothetical protein
MKSRATASNVKIRDRRKMMDGGNTFMGSMPGSIPNIVGGKNVKRAFISYF